MNWYKKIHRLIAANTQFIQEWSFDHQHQVETRKLLEKEEYTLSNKRNTSIMKYSPTHSRQFQAAIEMLDDEIKNHRFIDFGCGKGKVLFLAAEAGFTKITGIEIEKQLFDITKQNIHNSQFRNIDVYNMDALKYTVPGDASLFYFYHPFDIWVFEQVLSNIVESVINHPRNAYIIYVTPVHEELFYPERFTLIGQSTDFETQNFNTYKINSEPLSPIEETIKRMKKQNM